MSDVVMRVENISKQYRLGTVGTGTISHDLNRWWCRLRGKDDPSLKITEVNIRERARGSIDGVDEGLGRGRNAKGKRKHDYVWALRDINFNVEQGKVLGIIGRNGAGKSTLLKILSRVTAPTIGQVKAKGRIGSLLEVGTGFHPELTGRENIYLNGAILGMTKKEITRKLDEIVVFSGCARYVDTPVKRYSSGMMVRLGFAVAAHLEPELLIVDEVLAVGDVEFQRKCMGKMKDVAGHGRTVLLVSHNMASIQSICDKALLLDGGELVETGPAADIVRMYLSARESDGDDLPSRKDRLGGGPLRFKRVSIVSAEGQPVDVGVCGSDFRLKLEHVIENGVEARDVRITVAFATQDGIVLFVCCTGLIGNNLRRVAPSQSVILEIPHLPLLAGRYYVNVWCHCMGLLSDLIESATIIDIVDGDFYGSGVAPSARRQGYLAVKHNFFLCDA